MARVRPVLLDGLNAATARRWLTVLRALEKAKLVIRIWTAPCRPFCARSATLFSGLTPVQSGILRNLDAGYAVLVTSDHGMTADGAHNDVTKEARRVPLWLVGPAWQILPLRRRRPTWPA